MWLPIRLSDKTRSSFVFVRCTWSGISRQVCAGYGNYMASRRAGLSAMRWDWVKPSRLSPSWRRSKTANYATRDSSKSPRILWSDSFLFVRLVRLVSTANGNIRLRSFRHGHAKRIVGVGGGMDRLGLRNGRSKDGRMVR